MNAPLPESIRRALEKVTLDDKYALESGRAFMSGVQALVRLPMLQRVRDAKAGLDTAGFVSGYRGSPLGGYDQALWSAKQHLAAHHVVFRPGVNEELAATALWGTQQLEFDAANKKYDGVFGIWYGKGPGVDRCSDVFKHANLAGTSRFGGVIAVAGDDHVAKSSTAAHQSDHIFKACGLPVFFPASAQEILDLGLHAFAMSRFAGVWTAMKTIQEVVESAASIDIGAERVQIVLPQDFVMPSGGVHIRWPDAPLVQEARLYDHKWYAALAYVRANRLNHDVIAGPHDRFGIIASGKAFNDTRQALADLGLDDATCRSIGLRLHKVGVVWPLEATITREFARGLQEILVVEEKRQVIEYQLKEELYNWRPDVRPHVLGKFDQHASGEAGGDEGGEWSRPNPSGNWLLRAQADLTPAIIARAIAGRLTKLGVDADVAARMEARVRVIEAKDRALAAGAAVTAPSAAASSSAGSSSRTSSSSSPSGAVGGGSAAIATAVAPSSSGLGPSGAGGGVVAAPASATTADAPVAIGERQPWFCSGCPHNTSTRVPEGSIAMAGIGCHFMAVWMNRATVGFTQMGGEGVPWVGQAPFTKRRHMFANLGDGTYYHSGFLAVRQSVAAGVNITYKILVNDAVAMTGGQPLDGSLSVPQMTRELEAEGVRRIVIVTDQPEKYAAGGAKQTLDLAPGTTVRHRDDFDAVQRELRDTEGCTVLLYDQTCATEKRRRRKRGKLADPARRVVINELVCEGCGDCSVQSNCLSVEPVETEFGRKRRINQNTCNKDYSCLKGFCPSFVTVEGGQLRKPNKKETVARTDPNTMPPIPEPTLPPAEQAFGIVVAGIGGTGVITIGQLLGMAAHLEGKGVVTQDSAGLAQKGGATWSHIQIANRPEAIHTTKVDTAKADLVIACDAIVAAGKATQALMHAGRTYVALNTHATPTASFVTNANWQSPAGACEQALRAAVGGEAHLGALDAEEAAVQLLGDSIYSNPLLLGYAWQKGRLPVSREALLRAIELNGVQVDNNKAAFEWGRRCAHDLAAVTARYQAAQVIEFVNRKPGLDELVARRVKFLTAYQDRAYAEQYQAFVDKVRQAENAAAAAAAAASGTGSINDNSDNSGGRSSGSSGNGSSSGRSGGQTALTEAVARYLFKLMAYKDEYEVARLHTDPAFTDQIARMFEGEYKLVHHLAPPLTAKTNDKGELLKRPYAGAWLRGAVFPLLAKLKGLRGGPLDLFGRTEERRMERALIAQYRASIDEILLNASRGGGLSGERLALALEIARIPEEIRGYGHVKARHLAAARAKWDALMAKWRAGGEATPATATAAAVAADATAVTARV